MGQRPEDSGAGMFEQSSEMVGSSSKHTWAERAEEGQQRFGQLNKEAYMG